MPVAYAPDRRQTPNDLRSLEPQERLKRDIDLVHTLRDRLEPRISKMRGHLLAILSAAPDSYPHLKPAIERLIAQCRDSAIIPHIMIGLNNGTELPDKAFEDHAEVSHLHLLPKQRYDDGTHIAESQHSRRILSQWLMPAKNHPAVLLVSQPKHPAAAGKIAMKREMADILLSKGFGMPELLLMLDSESQFVKSPRQGEKMDLSSNGLELLVEAFEASPGFSLSGARMQVTAYETLEDGFSHPNPETLLSAHHREGNILRERAKLPSMAGGGMGGRTQDILPLVAAIAQYRSIRADDTAEVELARKAGYQVRTEHASTVLNRAPSAWEFRRAMKQLARWEVSMGPALSQLYGESAEGVEENIGVSPWSSPRAAFERPWIEWYKLGHKECIFDGPSHW
jgi:hypothetical protein